jgi:predicted ATPase
VGSNLILFGQATKGVSHCNEGVALWDENGSVSDLITYGDDPGSIGRAYAACGLWFLGYPDQATCWMNEAVAVAERTAYLPSLAFALNLARILDILCGAFDLAHSRAERTTEICARDVLPQRIAFSAVCDGRALVGMGQSECGHRKLISGLNEWHRLNARVWSGAFGTWATEACADIGRFEEAFEVASKTRDYIEQCLERAFEPELHRVIGTVFWKTGGPVERVEECFLRAIELSRVRELRSWELRAATSLALLWRGQDRYAEALDLLPPVYGWFTEGFGTTDLREAKVLLDNLS